MTRFSWQLHNPVPRRFRSHRVRALLVMLGMGFAGLVLAWRAIDLQVLQHDRLTELAQRQSQRTVPIKGQRGDLLDRHGERLAVSLMGTSLYAHPDRVESPSRLAFRLSQVLGVPAEPLEARLSSGRPFVWLARQLTPQLAQQVHDLALPGVYTLDEFRRVYPRRFLAASVLGFTGVDGQGLEGAEYAFDSLLKGAEGLHVVDRDALGRTLLLTGDEPLTGGNDVRLSLDPGLQTLAESALARAVSKWEALRGLAIVMDSNSGGILAMAQVPSFNPNTFEAYPKDTYFNRLVTAGYEPGSTFKIVTVAAALEEGAVEQDSLFYCEEGEYEHYDSVIHDTSPHAWLTLGAVIEVSSNICAAKVGSLLPAGVFHEFVRSLGFGSRPGIYRAPDGRQLSAEATGYVLHPEDWTPVDHAAIAFGHGILASPIQLITAINAVAAGGWLVPPRLVLEVRDQESGESIPWPAPLLRRVMSQDTATAVRDFMVGVVHGEQGTGKQAAVPGFQVAGKTGTTEKYDLEARGYSKTRHIASFVGFVPAEDPHLTLLVLIEEPAKGRYGGQVAAPVFREIAEQALPRLGVWPADVRRIELAAAPD